MRYRFSKFELDTERMEFRADAEVRALEPQVFDVLRHLVENNDRLVSRDELIEAVWGGRIVSDATISSRINAVRKALGDSGERQALIKTVPRRGFRFVAPVLREDEVSASQVVDTPTIEDRSSPVADKPSIAVLPFDSLGVDEDQQVFADGMTEEIITTLSKVSEMLIVDRNSVFTYKGKPVKVQQIAEDLGVRYVLKGSVRRAGDRIRVTAQLIDANDGRHMWADRFDREIADIFALQDEISLEIVTALQVKLTEGEQARLDKRQTTDFAAWECYVRGVSEQRRSTREGTAAARALLEKSVELDPEFGAAWTTLGRSHWQDARNGWTRSQSASLDLAAECADRSLAGDAPTPEAYALLGLVRMLQRRFPEAIAAGEEAIELGPGFAESYIELAQTLNYVGQPGQGAALLEKAMRLSPFHPDNLLGVLANSYRMLGRHDDAIVLDDERLRRNPDNFYSDFRLAAVYMELGRADEARHHVAEALKKNPSLTLRQVQFSEPYRDEAYLKGYLDHLRRAGLPE